MCVFPKKKATIGKRENLDYKVQFSCNNCEKEQKWTFAYAKVQVSDIDDISTDSYELYRYPAQREIANFKSVFIYLSL